MRFSISSHIILVTKETAFFPRVFAYNFAFGLLIILSSGQCSPAGSRMPGICHKQARRRYWCQTKFRNKCKKCPVCLRGHSFFSARPRPHHFNVGNECAQGGQTLNKKLKNLKNLSKHLKFARFARKFEMFG